MVSLPVYLDNHATTRVDPRVIEAMLPLMSENYGNAASRQHEFGWKAEAAVAIARRTIATCIGAVQEEIIFTSGATESISLALKGVAEALSGKGTHIVTAVTEHRAVLDTCARLRRSGFEVTELPVDSDGLVDPQDVRRAITSRTILVSVMAANNEIGTLSPLEEIGEICRSHNILLHSDATQAVGKIPMNVGSMNIDLLSFSAHKIYGPKGIGALYVRSARPSIRLIPQIDGGGHERGLRSGTLNVPGIAGFGKALALAEAEMKEESARQGGLRDRLVEGITGAIDAVRVNGHPTKRLPQNANLTFPGVRADALMMSMKDIAVSAGSACSSASPEPSHVLRAIGLSNEDAQSSLRFGLGRFTTEEEITYTITRVVESVRKLGRRHHYPAHA